MFIRYPGSKAKLRKKITDVFPDEAMLDLWTPRLGCYCEPFFGSGAIGWEIIKNLPNKAHRTVRVNDIDPGIACLWKAVLSDAKRLMKLIQEFKPSTDAFYQFKEEDGAPGIDPTLRGFRKLALHQMSFSGLGFMSGGPLGGKKQQSEYNPSCRWSPHRICKRIILCHNAMNAFRRFDITSEDFESVLNRLPDDAFAYLDPPYFIQGAALYKHAMTEEDHARLARVLRPARFQWVLSYDDHPTIRDLYSWARIGSFEMTPTMQTTNTKRRKNRELVIRPKTQVSDQ